MQAKGGSEGQAAFFDITNGKKSRRDIKMARDGYQDQCSMRIKKIGPNGSYVEE